MHSSLVSCLVILACSVVLIQAECPNGCSGRGSCSSKDMCQCYKNFQGNDCSERTCGFGYAHTDTAKGDLNMDGTIHDTTQITGSQVYPYGTWERYNDAAVDNEGHFYMECANQGLCDRETGDCVCFDGFEGSACQRASCPNSCSNHGSCESISEFATTAGGTLFTKGVATGDTTYDLWDAKVSYGCRCDPWFTGADCSQRLCKVGVDPMYYDTEQVTYDTIRIVLTDSIFTDKWIRIRFWDYWGESYITERITAPDDATVEAALEALPNGVISDDLKCVDLTTAEESTDFFSIKSTFSGAREILCQFKSNPGALRLPEIYEKDIDNAAITTTPLRGEDENLCNTLHTGTISGVTLSSTITLSDDFGSSFSEPFLAKYNDQYVVVTGLSNGDSTNDVLTMSTQLVSSVLTGLSADLYYSTTSLGNAKIIASGGTAGSTTITITGHGYDAGDKIICENQILNVVSVTSDDAFTVDRPFMGIASTAADSTASTCFKINTDAATTTPYVSECAGRGICDRESGVCSCFKGYTNDNCDKQSILAF